MKTRKYIEIFAREAEGQADRVRAVGQPRLHRHVAAARVRAFGDADQRAALGGLVGATERSLHQIKRIRAVEILRHALPIGDVVQRQPMPDQHVERPA